jgi:hypothetical protein
MFEDDTFESCGPEREEGACGVVRPLKLATITQRKARVRTLSVVGVSLV